MLCMNATVATRQYNNQFRWNTRVTLRILDFFNFTNLAVRWPGGRAASFGATRCGAAAGMFGHAVR